MVSSLLVGRTLPRPRETVTKVYESLGWLASLIFTWLTWSAIPIEDCTGNPLNYATAKELVGEQMRWLPRYTSLFQSEMVLQRPQSDRDAALPSL